MAERLKPSEIEREHPHVLIVSRKLDPHVDIIAKKLNEKKIPFVRFNTEDYPLKVTTSISFDGSERKQRLNFPKGRVINGRDVVGVWYRRPDKYQFSSEFSPAVHVFAEQETRSTIKGLWQILDCTWVNHPEKNRTAELKIKQLKVASDNELIIPKTLITNDPAEAERFFKKTKDKGVIIKRMGGGIMVEGDKGSAIYTSIVGEDDMKKIDQVKYTPALFQEYIQKDLELRVTVVGKKVFAAEIHSQESEKARIDWRQDTLTLEHKVHDLPKEVSDKLTSLVGDLGLNFGAIDMILTPEGKYVFLEINPNGQWGWIEDFTGLPISDSIIDLLTEKGD